MHTDETSKVSSHPSTQNTRGSHGWISSTYMPLYIDILSFSSIYLSLSVSLSLSLSLFVSLILFSLSFFSQFFSNSTFFSVPSHSHNFSLPISFSLHARIISHFVFSLSMLCRPIPLPSHSMSPSLPPSCPISNTVSLCSSPSVCPFDCVSRLSLSVCLFLVVHWQCAKPADTSQNLSFSALHCVSFLYKTTFFRIEES